jgi:hypothetical protein
MKKLGLIALLSLAPRAQAQMTSVYTPYQLDQEEAHLNKQWKRVEEIEKAQGQFLVIRRDLILTGYKQPIQTWFDDAKAWLDSWKSLVGTIGGAALIDQQARLDARGIVKKQLTALDVLIQRAQKIVEAGAYAEKSLRALPTFPGDYIDVVETSTSDSYQVPIEAYRNEVDRTLQALLDTQVIMNSDLTASYSQLANSLGQILELRMQALSLAYPELEDALKEAQNDLVQIRNVDRVLDRLEQEKLAISIEVTSGQIFEARKHLERWKKDGEQAMLELSRSKEVSPAMLKYAQEMYALKLGGIEAQIAAQLKARTDVQIFMTYYMNQLYGSFGLVKKCVKARPSNLDCNLLRTIQGFKQPQLLKLTSEQAGYMENVILRVKQGPSRMKVKL